jgi:hypothetical protein
MKNGRGEEQMCFLLPSACQRGCCATRSRGGPESRRLRIKWTESSRLNFKPACDDVIEVVDSARSPTSTHAKACSSLFRRERSDFFRNFITPTLAPTFHGGVWQGSLSHRRTDRNGHANPAGLTNFRRGLLQIGHNRDRSTPGVNPRLPEDKGVSPPIVSQALHTVLAMT